MTGPDPAQRAPALDPGSAARLSWLYAVALLLSALLLFWIQPLFTKMVLPLFGGAPAVWTTASMFFQFALLAGYLYAHIVSRNLSLRQQALIHLILLAAVFVLLPVHPDAGSGADAAREPVTALLWLLATGLGLPFFAVAATAPLLQRWFSHTRHADARDPYFLYSASNVGSMLALIAYPVAIEPLLGVVQQTRVWAYGYALLAALIAVCALAMWRHRHDDSLELQSTQTAPAVGWINRVRWMLLAAAPSSLMLGVTQHITTEIAAVPLLWVIPLMLYMLTYVNVFARRPPIRHGWMLRAQPPLIILLALVWILNQYLVVFLLHVVAFFVTAMMCHGELARQRPQPARLTEFYLCIALGGALGGAFNAIGAPLMFNSIIEYPLMIAIACMLRPPYPGGEKVSFGWRDLVWPLVLAAASALVVMAGYRPLERGPVAVVVYLQFVGVVLYLSHTRPIAFGLTVLVMLLATPLVHHQDQVLTRHRSFFGVHTVLKEPSGKYHLLLHGVTIHGAQYTAPEKRRVLTSYYHRDNALGQLFDALGKGERFRHVAAVGLGAGTVACYRRPGQEWTFYEIDPVVVQLATDTRYFTFLSECAPGSKIVIGDGRLSLAAAPDEAFDLIIADAFSSDAIPVHMITREALALYMKKLRAGGIVMFHISNQYMELTPVLSDLAAAAGLAAYKPGPRLLILPHDRYEQMESSWVAVARDAEHLKALETEEGWERLPREPHGRLWTDDYSNIVGALKYISGSGAARSYR